MSTTSRTGKVKFFNQNKAYGFIIEDDTKNDVFVHQTDCIDNISEGDRVSYEIKNGKKGPAAVHVQLIEN